MPRAHYVSVRVEFIQHTVKDIYLNKINIILCIQKQRIQTIFDAFVGQRTSASLCLFTKASASAMWKFLTPSTLLQRLGSS